jgi:hypothetical protein
MHKRNIETRSYNHCCHATAGSITYSECLYATLATQNGKRMRRILLPLCLYHVSSHCLKTARVSGEKLFNNKNVDLFSLQVFSLKYFAF